MEHYADLQRLLHAVHKYRQEGKLPDDPAELDEVCARVLNYDRFDETAIEWKRIADYEKELAMAWDDVTGKELDPNKVAKARAEEVEYISKTNLYTKVPRSKAKQCKAKVITVRWIDINKGDNINENYRSRLVAREIKTNNRPDLFAATPPLEALKVIISILTSANKGDDDVSVRKKTHLDHKPKNRGL